jgi:hypothetical protein
MEQDQNLRKLEFSEEDQAIPGEQAAESPSTNAEEGTEVRSSMREENGKFASGGQGGPGRPRKSTSETPLEIAAKVCTVEVWEAILEGAVKGAREGDAKAREWLTRLWIGKHRTVASLLHNKEQAEFTRGHSR